MATKNSSSVLVSGFSMGMAFIQFLVNEIVALGGFEEMLHPLTREHGRPIVKKLAEVIVKSEWRVPRSLMERLAATESMRQWGTVYQEDDRFFFWDIVGLTKRFGIPVVAFNNDCGDKPIPAEITEQIKGKVVTYPMVLIWDREHHIVVSVSSNGPWKLGEVNSDSLIAIKLAPSKYFDLER